MKVQSLDERMSSEIKQEMAERFFGFRRIIEEDKLNLEEKIKHYAYILQKRISFDLIRIYIMLRDEELIQEFLDYVGVDQRLFFDSYVIESPTIAARVFQCQQFHGFTKKRRFIRYFLECYERLVFHVQIYREKLEELRDDIDVLSEEIKRYYRQNDISAILGFLRSLGSSDIDKSLQGGIDVGVGEELARKLKIEPPIPVEQRLPALHPLKPLGDAKKVLKNLAGKAFSGQTETFLNMFTQKKTPCDRRGDINF